MKHFIIVKFNNSLNLAKSVESTPSIFNKSLNIDGVDKVEVYISNTNLQNRHDIMIEMSLTLAALEIFDNSEIHKEWKSQYGEYIINKTIFNCN